jgi:phospholipid/cholesterol/gamma-HCH transport system substrate-binding protein
METRAHYVAVGAFVLTMVFLAFVAVLWLAGTQFSTSLAHYDIFFEGPVSGLSVGAKAEYNGIPVGTVSDIEIITDRAVLAENGGKPIRVTIEIKSNTPVHKDSAATIQTNILSGVSYILISPGRSQELLEAKRGERYPVIRSRRATLASLAARGPQLLDKLDVILDHLDDLLNDENRTRVSDILENVRKVSASLAQHGDEIASNAGSALKAAAGLFTNLDNSYSKQGGLKDQLSVGLDKAAVALTDFDKLVKGLEDTNKQLGGAVQDLRPGVRNFSQHTLGDVDALIAETRQFISGLSRLASQLERDPQRILFGDRREGYQPK